MAWRGHRLVFLRLFVCVDNLGAQFRAHWSFAPHMNALYSSTSGPCMAVAMVISLTACGGPQRALEYGSEPIDLPQVLVTYSLACVRRAEFAPLFQADDQNPITAAFHALDRSLRELPGEFPERLRATEDTRNVPVGASYAVVGEEPRPAFLVIPQDDGGAMLVVSSVEPGRTSVILVDPQYRTRLVYDTEVKNEDGGGSETRLGPVTGIRVYEGHRFSVEDLPEEGGYRRVQDFVLEEDVFYFESPRI